MKKEFIVNRQGKDFVLYAGLIDQATMEGLIAIHTQLVQAPSEENGQMAIVHAQVSILKDVRGELRICTFEGIGDANPQNVGRMIAPHTTRMAETRAKARALRDAINVGITALEELGETGEHEDGEKPRAEAPRRQPNPERAAIRQAAQEIAAQTSSPANAPVPIGRAASAVTPDAPATPQQLDKITKLEAALGRVPSNRDDLTIELAAAAISALVREFNAGVNKKRG